jgi:hypothetical protein
MQLQLLGPHPLEIDQQSGQRAAIGTIFPSARALYTRPPQLHAYQRLGFIDFLNEERASQNLARLTQEQEEEICSESVDLIFEPDAILIRPDPERMDLAFAADELLQELVSKRQIKFLKVNDARVRDAIKARGECWRLSSLPRTAQERRELVFNSKVAIQGLPVYFYNRLTGTRWLTVQTFNELANLDDKSLAGHLDEIAEHSTRVNRHGAPEVSFFAATIGTFGARDFSGRKFAELPADELRSAYEELRNRFAAAVHDGFRKDDCDNRGWSKLMLATLFLDGSESQTEETLSGLSPEFFMQVEWLPGGRFEDGEFIFDSVFDEAAKAPADPKLARLCDLRAKGIIFNLIREYGDIEYINVARVPESLSRRDENLQARKHRGVFLAELKPGRQPEVIKRLARFQKYGVWEHLDQGKDLLAAIQDSDEYGEYWLDRRLGCRALRMNIIRRVSTRRLTEVYTGAQARYQGQVIRTSYFDRQYVHGTATDKIPAEKYSQPEYARKFAQLLGEAAAPSMIVGRSLMAGKKTVFDDGDEVVVEDAKGLPEEIILGDHSGSFGDYEQPLETFASHYARPVNERRKFLANPAEFADVYLNSLRNHFSYIQNDYRRRRRAFDNLFKHCRYDQGGSFAYRWERILRRLDNTDVEKVIAAIRSNITILSGPG